MLTRWLAGHWLFFCRWRWAAGPLHALCRAPLIRGPSHTATPHFKKEGPCYVDMWTRPSMRAERARATGSGQGVDRERARLA